MKKKITFLLLFIAFQMNAQCWQTISSGTSHTLGIKTDGTLWAWGDNANGQLGLGNTTIKKTPTQIGTATNWVYVSSGFSASFAIKSDGTLWAWGKNLYGRLGDGTQVNKLVPTQISTDTNWVSVDSKNHTVAVKSDGTLWAWGFNSTGQLGDGTWSNTVYKLTPAQVGTDTNWKEVYAGSNFTLALKTNGTLWSCGYNSLGQLGDGTFGEKHTLVQVGSATDWDKISAGNEHSLAIKINGTLWAWGGRSYGQLGNGTINASTGINSPIQVGADTDWKLIAVTTSHSLAVKNNGTLWAWGDNIYGQIGDGTTTTRTSPVQIGTATNWLQVCSRGGYSTAIKTDGSLSSWGFNFEGQLGDGTTVPKSIPTGIACPVSFLSADDFSNEFTFSVYPNPANDVLFINNSTDLKIDFISIIDLTGKKVFEQKENTSSINVQQLESGMYIMQITSEGNNYQNKFIKR